MMQNLENRRSVQKCAQNAGSNVLKTSKGYSAETDKSTNIRSVFDRPALTSIKSLCIVLYKYFDISYPNLHLQSLDKKYQKFIILSVFVYQIISINF